MLKVSFDKVVNFNSNQKETLELSRYYLEKILNSAEFKDDVLNFTWLGKKQFSNDNGLTNEEIYNLIMSGKEVLKPTVDGIMNIQLTLYTSNWFGRSTIGYTYPNTPMQWINSRHFNNMNESQVAGNLIHEYCHKLGFEHDFKVTVRRPFSVPYGIGNIIAQRGPLYVGNKIVSGFNEKIG